MIGRQPSRKEVERVKARAVLIDRAMNDGATAAYWGKPYDDNPHTDAQLKLAWSQGHNGARVRMAIDKDNR